MFPFLLPADALRLTIRMGLAGAEANRAFWCAMVQAGTWWMPHLARPVAQAPQVDAPTRRSRAKARR